MVWLCYWAVLSLPSRKNGIYLHTSRLRTGKSEGFRYLGLFLKNQGSLVDGNYQAPATRCHSVRTVLFAQLRDGNFSVSLTDPHLEPDEKPHGKRAANLIDTESAPYSRAKPSVRIVVKLRRATICVAGDSLCDLQSSSVL